MIKVIFYLTFLSISVFSNSVDSIYDFNIHLLYDYSPGYARSKELAFENIDLSYPIHKIGFGTSYELKSWLHPALFVDIHYGGCTNNMIANRYSTFELQSQRYGFHIVPGLIFRVIKIQDIAIYIDLLYKYGWAYEEINSYSYHESNRVNMINYSFSGLNKGVVLKTSVEYRLNPRQSIALAYSYNRSSFNTNRSYYDKQFELPYMGGVDIGGGIYVGVNYTYKFSDKQKVRNILRISK